MSVVGEARSATTSSGVGRGASTESADADMDDDIWEGVEVMKDAWWATGAVPIASQAKSLPDGCVGVFAVPGCVSILGFFEGGLVREEGLDKSGFLLGVLLLLFLLLFLFPLRGELPHAI